VQPGDQQQDFDEYLRRHRDPKQAACEWAMEWIVCLG
jgi:hypothetical protein